MLSRVWLRDYLQSIRYWHAYLLFWGVSYPDLALVDHFDRLDETVRICRAEAFAWATSQIFA
jgi:4-amino-4-deoxy-L-arabinose transferase-like glycosyltransferase